MPSRSYNFLSLAIASDFPGPSYSLPRWPSCSAAHAAPIRVMVEFAVSSGREMISVLSADEISALRHVFHIMISTPSWTTPAQALRRRLQASLHGEEIKGLWR